MDTQRWERIGDIFERLLGAPQAERSTLLDSLCGDDAELKQIVVSMLESEDSARNFDESIAKARVPLDAILRAQEQVDASLIGTRVGPWRLESKLGTGGMGVVWLAQRADGQFEQRAALKLIKRGMDSEAVIARFLRERQILARLDHPHIAHLIDGGVAEDGRPYFAMEYVDGVPLLRYCHENDVKLDGRIKLFLDICAALAFAHEHHVVHRDLKPSNLLVTGKGEVKLLDFGIAKMIEGEDGIAATLTDIQRERPMTPAYAAPEQIAGGKISERTDVYALGCVLYELLTGQHTHDFKGISGAKDILRIVQSTDPVAPSMRRPPVAAVPQRRLRGDLDTIVLTALRRDPERRYASVSAFAADLQSYLSGNPISARRDSVFYRAYKFTRRHRTGMVASLAVAAIAIAAITIELRDRPLTVPITPGSSMAVVDFNNLSQQPTHAWLAPALAEMLSARLIMGGTLHAVPDELVRPAHADLAAPLAGGYATKSLATLRKRLGADYVVSGSYLVSGNAADAKVHLDLAMQDARTGAALASISQSGALSDLPAIVAKAGSGLREQAGFSPVSAIEEKEIGKAQPPNIEVARHMGIALDALQKSDPARAKDELLQAISLAPGYAPAYVYLAQAWKVLGYDAKALAAVQQAAAFSDGLPVEQKLLIEREVSAQTADWPKALELDKKLLATDPKNPELQFNLIDDLVDAGKPAEAETALAETRKSSAMQGDPRIDLKAARIAFARGDSAAQAQHALLALQQAQARDEQAVLPKAKQNLSIALNALGKRDEAEKLTREAIDDYQRIGNPHGEADMRIMLAIIMEENGKLQAERDEYQHALEIYQRSGNQYGIAVTYQNLQRVLWNQGDHDGAEAAGKNALGIFREIGNLKGQVGVLAAMAAVQMDDGVTDSAMESLRQVIELSERIGDRVHLVDALNRYADGLRLRGSLIDAQEICSRAQLESKLTGDPFSAMVTVFTCASLTLDRGNVAVAATTFGNARSMAETLRDDSYVASADEILANIDMEQGNWQSASDRLKPAIATFAADDSVADEAAVQAMLALCNQKLDRPTERDAATKRARELRSRITRRLDSIVVDISLARLIGEMGDSRHAADLLKTLADDAEKGNWLGLALEARLIALRFLDQSHDPSADQWRTQLESKARQHGFGWILARLALTRDSQHPRGR